MDQQQNPSDLNRVYNQRIVANMKKYMAAHSISQNALAGELSKCGLNINQGNISKCFKLDMELPLSMIVKFCEAYGLTLEELLNKDFLCEPQNISTNEETAISDLTDKGPDNAVLYIPHLGSSFISNADHLDFRGWLQTYHIYFYPTLSSVNEILRGTLTLEKCEKTGVCRTILRLNTNRFRKDGTPIQKEYTGCAIISKSVNALYVILSSQEEGELCMLNLRHFFIRHQLLNCRMAAVLTNSAGECHVPTLHRALISREELRDEDLQKLLPQLHLNTNKVIIRQADLEKLLDELSSQDPRYTKIKANLASAMNAESIYIVKEDFIRSTAHQNLDSKKDTMEFMSMVRDASHKARYNKISNKVDEYVHDFLRSLGYYRDQGEG